MHDAAMLEPITNLIAYGGLAMYLLAVIGGPWLILSRLVGRKARKPQAVA